LSTASHSPLRALAASAPGKLILAGEHAAVYGRPALVAAVDARLVVEGGERAERGIDIDLSDLGLRETTSGAALREYAARAQERWRAFHDDPTPQRFRELRGDDPAHLVKVALGETLLRHGGAIEPAWAFRVVSKLPVGSGMGSSAAAAAALTAAAMRLLGRPADLDEVETLVRETERRQHGSPSGVDGAVVLRGGVQWVERAAEGALRLEALPSPLPLLEEIRVLDTGSPGQSTGEVVTAVRQLRAADPARFEELLDRLEQATRRVRDALVASAASVASAELGAREGAALADAIHDAQRGLEALGVVPPEVRALVRRIEGRGGAAKVSGAGALHGPGAGCLVVYHPHPASLFVGGLIRPESLLPVRLGAPGLRVEERA
jgi:mevalonate kinase